MQKDKGNPFWTFSLALYGKPGVAAACLNLQENAGVDVNIMLYILWRASERVSMDDAGIAGVAAETEAWRDQVVRPLRAVRQWLKDMEAPGRLPGAEKVRADVKKVELEAEYWQQVALYDLASRLPLPDKVDEDLIALARHNLAAYARNLGTEFPDDAVEAVLAGFAEVCAKT